MLETWPPYRSRLPAPATLTVPQLGEPKTLSPNFASDTLGFAPTSNVYSHLVAIDWGVNKGTGAYGDLAESWTTSADGKTVTFKLHKAAKWHDGKSVTAHDVKFTFDTIIRKKYPAFVVLKNVKEITVPDDHTVVLHLIDPEVGFVPMLAQVSTWTAKIYPKHLWEGQDGFDSGRWSMRRSAQDRSSSRAGKRGVSSNSRRTRTTSAGRPSSIAWCSGSSRT